MHEGEQTGPLTHGAGGSPGELNIEGLGAGEVAPLGLWGTPGIAKGYRRWVLRKEGTPCLRASSLPPSWERSTKLRLQGEGMMEKGGEPLRREAVA